MKIQNWSQKKGLKVPLFCQDVPQWNVHKRDDTPGYIFQQHNAIVWNGWRSNMGQQAYRFLDEVYAEDELEVEYSILDKKDGGLSEVYGILSIDVQIKRISDNNLVIVSHRNLQN